MNKGFKDRLRICVIYLCFLLLKQGEMLPVFQKTFLGPLDLWNFYFENWVLFKNRLRVFVFVFAYTSKQGEMLPVFQKRLLGPIRSLKFVLKKTWFQPMFSEAFHEQGLQGQAQNFVLFIFVFCFRTGGNAVRFSNTFFGHFWSLKFLLWKLGPSDVFRIFPCTRASRTGSRWLRVSVFVFAFTSKQGKCCPFWKKKTFWVQSHPKFLNDWQRSSGHRRFWKGGSIAPVFTGSEKYWLAWHLGKTQLGNISPVLHRKVRQIEWHPNRYIFKTRSEGLKF